MVKYKCRICNNDENNTSYVAREMRLGSRDKFTYFKCSECGCLQIEKYPDNISDYYASYHTFDKKSLNEKSYHSFARRQLFDYKMNQASFLGRIISKLSPESFDWVEPFMFNFDSSILDIGCRMGNSLYRMAKAGFTNLQGIDAFLSEEIKYNVNDRDIWIKKKDIYQLNEKFDFIMLHHVLEHLPDQHRVFEKLVSLMHKDSKLLFDNPIIDSYVWDEYGVNSF